MIRISSRAAVAGAILMLATPAAHAHMTFVDDHAVPGAEFAAVLALPHGCDGAPTDTVRVHMPEGFYNVRAMPNPGWSVETVEGSYDTPIAAGGSELTGGVREIVWSGGSLADSERGEFAFVGTFSDALEGQAVFAVDQMCGDSVQEWTPAVALGAEDAATGTMEFMDHAGHMDHAEHMGDADAPAIVAGEAVVSGDLRITTPFTRATLPNAQVGGGYLSIENTGDTDDTLVAANSPLAGEVQIHEMSMVNDIMEMRQLNEGIALPAGETVTLAPGGLHLMLMNITEPFVEGEAVPVTLTFENAGSVDIELAVAAFGAAGAAMDHGGEH